MKKAASSADVMKFVSIGSFVVGSASLVGAALYLIVPSSARRPAEAARLDVRVVPAIGPGFSGVAARGAF